MPKKVVMDRVEFIEAQKRAEAASEAMLSKLDNPDAFIGTADAIYEAAHLHGDVVGYSRGFEHGGQVLRYPAFFMALIFMGICCFIGGALFSAMIQMGDVILSAFGAAAQ